MWLNTFMLSISYRIWDCFKLLELLKQFGILDACPLADEGPAMWRWGDVCTWVGILGLAVRKETGRSHGVRQYSEWVSRKKMEVRSASLAVRWFLRNTNPKILSWTGSTYRPDAGQSFNAYWSNIVHQVWKLFSASWILCRNGNIVRAISVWKWQILRFDPIE